MLKLTFDGTKFRDDQGRVVTNDEIAGQLYRKYPHLGPTEIHWPHGYEVVNPVKGITPECRAKESIKLIPPSERANDRHEKSKQLFKEFLNSEEAKEIIGTMKDEKLTPEQGSELVEIYKKAGWYADEANKECPYCAPDGTIWRDGSMICPHCKGSHFIVEEANKNDMKDFKKFTTLEQHPTTATNSTEVNVREVKPTPANAEEKELGWEYNYKWLESIKDAINKMEDCSTDMETVQAILVHIGFRVPGDEAKPEPTKKRIGPMPHEVEVALTEYINKIGFTVEVQKYVRHGARWAWAEKQKSQPSPSEEPTKDEHVLTGVDWKRAYKDREQKLTASESRVKELEERIEALLDNHGLTHAKIKQIAAEERVKELEALAVKLADSLEDSNDLLKDRAGMNLKAILKEDSKLIQQAKALKP